jgi:glucan phosphoethanolaminetransferase (alkaline phosphatase superfamily)
LPLTAASVRPGDRRRALTTLVLVVAGQLILSGAFIAFFAWRFPPLGRRFQIFHVSIVAALLFATALGVGALTRFHRLRTRTVQRAVSGVLGAAWALLLLLYAADIVSNRLWRENIHLDRLTAYGQWVLGFESAAAPFSPWVYAMVATGLGGVIGFFVLFSDRLFLGIESLVRPAEPYSLFRDARRSRQSAALLVVCGLGLGGELGVLSRLLIGEGLLHRDPIVAFFRPQSQVGQFGWYLTFAVQQQRVAAERAAYRQLQQSATRNVIVIIVDSLRADHLPLYGYSRQTAPFLSRLLSEGHLRKVQLALSSCALSPCGILSTMSGKYVPQVQADFKIFDLLHDLGYQSYFILGGHHEQDGLRLAYGTEQALYLDGTNAGRYSSQDDHYVLDGLTRLPRNKGDKAFFYIHLMSAHWAGTKWPEYARFVPSDAQIGLGTVFRGAGEHDRWVNRYDNGVLQSDAVIEQIFDKLSSLGYLEHSTVFILGDHGEALGDHGPTSYFHGDILYQETVHIPLLIDDDPTVAYRNLEFASQIDVAPTIADRLSLAIPASWRGQSLLKPAMDRALTIGDPECGGVLYRHDGRIDKYFRCESTHAEALYDLTADPGETRNLIEGSDPALVHLLRTTLERGALPEG